MNDPRTLKRASSAPFFYGWVVVAACAVVAFLGTGLFSYTRGIFMPWMTEAFGVGRFEIALGFSLEAGAAAAFAPFLGRYLDIGSPRRVLLLGAALVTMGYFCLYAMQALWQFYAIMIGLFGVGMSCMGMLPWNKIAVTWFSRRRGLALAIGVMGAAISGILMPPVANWLVETFSWRQGFFAYSVTIGVVLLPTIYWMIIDRPEDIGTVVDGDQNASDKLTVPALRKYSTRDILRSRSFWVISFIFAIMLCVLGVVLLHLYGHMLDLGLSTIEAASVVSAMAAASAFGKPLIGWISDRFGFRSAIALSLALQLAALLLFIDATTYVVALLTAGVYGLGYSGTGSLQSLAASMTFGSHAFAQVRGLMTPVMLPITISASPLAGFIHDLLGSYAKAFIVLAVALGFAMGLTLLLRPKAAAAAV